MHRPKKWNLEALIKEAQSYKTLKEFRTNSESAYKAYIALGKPEPIVSHLDMGRTYWTEDTAMAVARTYTDRWSFQKGSGGAYRFLWKRNKLDNIFGPLEDTNNWTEESIRKCASSCKNRTDFKSKYPGGHKRAYELGLLSELFGETFDTPFCDNDLLYIWKVSGFCDVYKVGISSQRLADKRIKYVERKSGLKAERVWFYSCDNAKELENMILSKFEKHVFEEKFSGSTEFIKLRSPHDLKEMAAYLRNLNGASIDVADQPDLVEALLRDIAELPFDKEKYASDLQEKKVQEEQSRQAEQQAMAQGEQNARPISGA